jgi:hypothetical protein
MISVIDILNLVVNLCKDVDFPAPCMDYYLRCSEVYYDKTIKSYSPEVRKCFIVHRPANIKLEKQNDK